MDLSIKKIVACKRCKDALSILQPLLESGRSFSKSGLRIKQRDVANDDFTTPRKLALFHINSVKKHLRRPKRCTWFDPFKGSGNYYNQFPCKKKRRCWTEIKCGTSFYDFEKRVDVICSNPPYSQIWNVLVKSISLRPKIISFLISAHNLTPKRIELLEKNNYGLVYLHICKIRGWYGMNYIVIFKKGTNSKSIILFNCIKLKIPSLL